MVESIQHEKPPARIAGAVRRQRVTPAASQAPAVLQQLIGDAATRWLAVALDTELRAFLAAHGEEKLPDGSQAVVCNGYLPARVLRTSVGGIRVRVPRTRDRGNGGALFNSVLVPPYHARSRLDARLPQAFLRACLTQDPRVFLETLLGTHVRALPAPKLMMFCFLSFCR
jgi:hypothetical protein